MCRWIAYQGQPIFMEKLVTQPAHSLIHQSLHTALNYHRDGSLWTTNGDGFGIGWYSEKATPGLFKDARPAWNDNNLTEICEQVQSRLFMAHIRAVTTGAVQRSNSHPFKCKNWLFQHNGYIGNFEVLRRDLQMEIAPDLYPELKGTTDSETFFLLAMTYGLETNPKEALQKTVRRVRIACSDAKMESVLNLSCAMTDGETLYTLRYAEGEGEKEKTQFYSTDSHCMSDLNIGNDNFLPENSVVVVSEPLDQLSGSHWVAVPENSFTTIRNNKVEIESFMD